MLQVVIGQMSATLWPGASKMSDIKVIKLKFIHVIIVKWDLVIILAGFVSCCLEFGLNLLNLNMNLKTHVFVLRKASSVTVNFLKFILNFV